MKGGGGDIVLRRREERTISGKSVGKQKGFKETLKWETIEGKRRRHSEFRETITKEHMNVLVDSLLLRNLDFNNETSGKCVHALKKESQCLKLKIHMK